MSGLDVNTASDLEGLPPAHSLLYRANHCIYNYDCSIVPTPSCRWSLGAGVGQVPRAPRWSEGQWRGQTAQLHRERQARPVQGECRQGTAGVSSCWHLSVGGMDMHESYSAVSFHSRIRARLSQVGRPFLLTRIIV